MHTHSIEDFRMHTSSSGKRIHETSASLSLARPVSHHNRGRALSRYPWLGTTLSVDTP